MTPSYYGGEFVVKLKAEGGGAVVEIKRNWNLQNWKAGSIWNGKEKVIKKIIYETGNWPIL